VTRDEATVEHDALRALWMRLRQGPLETAEDQVEPELVLGSIA
jgi:hypothetical protein